MNSLLTSITRTYVPIIAGAIISFLTTRGITLDGEAAASLVIFLTAVIQGVYYLIGRLLERRFPRASFLLGSSKKPIYKENK